VDEKNFDPDRFLDEARAAGLTIAAEGDDLVLEAVSEPTAELLARLEEHAPTILARIREPRPPSGSLSVGRKNDFPPIPEFLDRVKNPRPGDLPVGDWVRYYPSGGLIPGKEPLPEDPSQ
jgi:hypothetical protein